MADYCRLRQICLVTVDLPRAIGDMQGTAVATDRLVVPGLTRIVD